MYLWNIDQWVRNEIPIEVRQPVMIKWLQVLLKPVKDLHATFETYRLATIKKMRYNGQVIVLENVLNDLFDPTQRRFRINTTYDSLHPLYIYTQPEIGLTVKPLYLYRNADYAQNLNLQKVYLYTYNELGLLYDFVVLAPDTFTAVTDITKLKAIVNLHRLAGKKATYRYINSLESF